METEPPCQPKDQVATLQFFNQFCNQLLAEVALNMSSMHQVIKTWLLTVAASSVSSQSCQSQAGTWLSPSMHLQRR